jgi:hypothetical protein
MLLWCVDNDFESKADDRDAARKGDGKDGTGLGGGAGSAAGAGGGGAGGAGGGSNDGGGGGAGAGAGAGSAGDKSGAEGGAGGGRGGDGSGGAGGGGSALNLSDIRDVDLERQLRIELIADDSAMPHFARQMIQHHNDTFHQYLHQGSIHSVDVYCHVVKLEKTRREGEKKERELSVPIRLLASGSDDHTVRVRGICARSLLLCCCLIACVSSDAMPSISLDAM